MDDKTPTNGMQKIVDDGVRQFEAIEKQLTVAFDAVTKLASIWTKGQALGMLGALETGRLTWKTRYTAGLIAETLTAIYELHEDGTSIAQKNNCDIPVIEGGGGGR